jgi:hypothetical protein
MLVHVGATLFMVGVIWFVQVVHYPLFSRVGLEKFSLYSEAHSYETRTLQTSSKQATG